MSAQVIQEYLAAATRQGVTTGQPPLATMMINIRSFRRSLRVVYPSPQTLNRLITLLQAIPAAGKQVHDTNIVATMQVYRIPRLLTHIAGQQAMNHCSAGKRLPWCATP